MAEFKNISVLIQNPIFKIGVRTLAVFLVVIAASWFLASDISSRSQNFALEKRKLIQVRNQINSAVALKEDFKRVKDILPKLDKIFLTNDQILNFVNLLEKTASETGTQITFNFVGSALPSKTVSGLNAVRFNLSIQGTSSGILAFLDKFYAFPNPAALHSLDFEGQYGIDAFSLMKSEGELFLKSSASPTPAAPAGF